MAHMTGIACFDLTTGKSEEFEEVSFDRLGEMATKLELTDRNWGIAQPLANVCMLEVTSSPRSVLVDTHDRPNHGQLGYLWPVE